MPIGSVGVSGGMPSEILVIGNTINFGTISGTQLQGNRTGACLKVAYLGAKSLGTKNEKNKQNFGFTLIESTIVVAIVAIIAAVAYPSYQAHPPHQSSTGKVLVWLNSRNSLSATTPLTLPTLVQYFLQLECQNTLAARYAFAFRPHLRKPA